MTVVFPMSFVPVRYIGDPLAVRREAGTAASPLPQVDVALPEGVVLGDLPAQEHLSGKEDLPTPRGGEGDDRGGVGSAREEGFPVAGGEVEAVGDEEAVLLLKIEENRSSVGAPDRGELIGRIEGRSEERRVGKECR